MRALHFGAGNIGRGFIGKVLAESGQTVVYADVVAPLITELQKRKQFPVRVVGDTEHIDIVKIEGAVLSNTDAVLDEIVAADILTTAVGPRILPRIAGTIAKGLKERKDKGRTEPLNIIACENAIRATSTLREYILAELTEQEYKDWATQNVGFVDCAVDRIVPPAKDEDPLGVTVEDFCEWVVDQTQFKGPLPKVDQMIFTDKLDAFVERKLLTVNTGHAICAYLGKLYGHKEIRTAILDDRIRPVVEGAMRESGAVLVARYGLNPDDHEAYIQKILKRYANPHIVDDVTRVGREPIRKLSPEDRLIKPLRGAIELNLPHTNLIKGVAAALLYKDPEDPQAVKLQKTVEALGFDGALSTISNLSLSHQQAVGQKVRTAVEQLNSFELV